MKKIITLFAAAMLCCATTFAKDLKVLVVKTAPEMHCNNCENKIKGNIRFTPGVKKIDTSLEAKTVTITYDAEKTDSKKIIAAFKKIGYDATVVSDNKQENKKQPVDGQTGATQQAKKK
ncbi:MAG: heavy-metal-associated domain-containing protein [Prevotellaceae bacterium]|nr:heavy-metal-associated domain-containing protein [Candidatus Minthosoma caballi]